MPTHNFARPRGRLVEIEIDSLALRDNRLGDPHRRTVAVYVPAAHPGQRLPLFVALAAFGGSGFKMLNWQSFGESLVQRLDRLIATGVMGPVVLALPDGFTRLGGNQWVDSPILGRWEAFVLEDLIPALEREFPVIPEARSRAIFGHSSGGYGALVHGLRHGSQWGAVASHSGDVGWDIVYGRGLAAANAALASTNHDVGAWLERVWAADSLRHHEFETMMLLAMAASYAPEPGLGLSIRLPVDPRTCLRDRERWQRWLAHDPLELVHDLKCQASLRALTGLWLDVGSHDEYFLQFGTRAFSDALTELAIMHTFEEHPGGHSGHGSQLDRSLPWLYRTLMGS